MAKNKEAELQELLDAALAENAKLKENPEALKAALESDKVKELQTKLDELNGLEGENETLRAQNDALKAELKAKASALSSFTHEIDGTYKAKNGKVYKIRKGHKKFTMKNKEYKSEDVITDAVTMEILIEERSGIIEEVVEPEK